MARERILCVAEKPSVARALVAAIRGKLISDKKVSKNISVLEIETNLRGHCTLIITSSSGHLTEIVPKEEALNSGPWNSIDPNVFLTCELVRKPIYGMGPIKKMIHTAAKSCERVIIWTDCDREGEHIGFEILETIAEVRKLEPEYVVSKATRTIPIIVERAVFNSTTPEALRYAFEHTTTMNPHAAIAVETRREIDLRVGYSATRAQTLGLKSFHSCGKNSVLSFGPCQCPTLSYVVSRDQKANPTETSSVIGYSINVHTKHGGFVFKWNTGYVYSRSAFNTLFSLIIPPTRPCVFRVNSFSDELSTIQQPRPLNTVVMLQDHCHSYKVGTKMISRSAEHLYVSQMISYPRSETNTWAGNEKAREEALKKLVESKSTMPMNIQILINEFLDTHGGTIPKNLSTRDGTSNDRSHPPVHPTGYFNHSAVSKTIDMNLYRHIVALFLASMCPAARVKKFKVNGCLSSAYEQPQNYTSKINSFTASARNVEYLGYARIFNAGGIPSKHNIADTWSEKKKTHSNALTQLGLSKLPVLLKDFSINTVDKKHTCTTTEASIVHFMSTHAIGTDSSISSIIQTLEQRGYITIKKGKVDPTEVGTKLSMFHESLTSPTDIGLRGEYTFPQKRALVELRMRMISNDGQEPVPQQFPTDNVYGFNVKMNTIHVPTFVRGIVNEAVGEAETIVSAVKQESSTSGRTSNVTGNKVTRDNFVCGGCGANANVVIIGGKCKFACRNCSRYIDLNLPNGVTSVAAKDQCTRCKFTRVEFIIPGRDNIVSCFGCSRLNSLW